MFSFSMRWMASLPSWWKASEYFSRTKPVRSNKWASHQRPLYNSRARHYRIERRPEGAYDLWLYNRAMVRYEAPKDGTHVVLLRGYNTSTSWNFLDHHGWNTWRLGAVVFGEGKRVFPLAARAREPYTAANGVVVPEDWSALITLDERERILRDRSAHRPAFVPRTTSEDSAKRAAFRKVAEDIVMVMGFRMPTFLDHARSLSEYELYRRGRSFGGRVCVLGAGDAVCMLHRRVDDPSLALSEHEIDVLSKLAQEAYTTLYAKRWYVRSDRKSLGESDLPTVEEFSKSFTSALLSEVGLLRKSGAEELEQFPKKLPSRWHT